MELISWVAVGAIAGFMARWFAPRSAPDGFVVSIPIGISGASLGGFVVGVPSGPGAPGFNVWLFFVPTLGAVILLLVYGLVARRAA
jgi:uncharacterized membrane protein YeaQ/YmgE (transglycosylase-associated protein family)